MSASRIGFGPRLGAYVLDIVFGLIIGFILGALLGSALGGILGGSEDGGIGSMLGAAGGMIAGAIAGIPLAFLIFMLMEMFMGRTPGKMILGIRIKGEGGSDAGMSALLIRALLKYSGTLLTILAGVLGVTMLASVGQIAGAVILIGCFFVLGAKKQSFHDILSKTAVFKN